MFYETTIFPTPQRAVARGVAFFGTCQSTGSITRCVAGAVKRYAQIYLQTLAE